MQGVQTQPMSGNERVSEKLEAATSYPHSPQLVCGQQDESFFPRRQSAGGGYVRQMPGTTH